MYPGAGEEAGAGEEVMGSAREAPEAPPGASDEDEGEGLAARAISRVKSIARGIMEKVPGTDEYRSPGSDEEGNESERAMPRRQKTGKAKAGAKNARGGRKKAGKGGKKSGGRKAGRAASARAAKKGTRGAGGKLKKQPKRGKSGGKRRPSGRKGKK
jgi:hypothetical protein